MTATQRGFRTMRCYGTGHGAPSGHSVNDVGKVLWETPALQRLPID
jgi:hypothetical protein